MNRELTGPGRLDRLIERTAKEPCERIYAGSSFCSQYFLHIAEWEWLTAECRRRNWKLTLTLPVFSEKDLDGAKERIRGILCEGADVIDEVTVNDPGMLIWIKENTSLKKNLGRLFFKDPRDVRIRGYDQSETTPALLQKGAYRMLTEEEIHGVELDWTSSCLNLGGCSLDGIRVGIHGPLCYMSTGNICKYASLHRKMEQKFRPNSGCSMECAGIYEEYREIFGEKEVEFFRFGRTVYYRVDQARVLGAQIDREIYFPMLEVKELLREERAAG